MDRIQLSQNMAPKIILYMPKESSSPIFVILRFIHMKLVLGIIGYYHYAKLTGANVDLIFYLLKNGISFLTTLKVPVNLMILRLIIGNLWTISFRILIPVYAFETCLLM